MYKAKSVKALMKQVDKNDLGLPIYIYKANLLSSPEEGTELEDLHSPAKYEVSYDEGFPTVDGKAIWLQFDFENIDIYRCFSIYLRGCETGIRSLTDVLSDPECPRGLCLRDLKEFYDLYMWKHRIKAYDLYNIAYQRKIRDHRIVESQNDDFIIANQLLDVAKLYMNENQSHLIENMSPKALLEFINTATKLRRVSLNMKDGDEVNNGNQSVEVIMKTLAKDSSDSRNNIVIDNNSGELSNILQDDDALKMAQELIIKVNMNDKKE